MSEAPLEPLDGDLDALLRAERGAEPPGEALDRVWSRLGSGLPPAGSGGGSSYILHEPRSVVTFAREACSRS